MTRTMFFTTLASLVLCSLSLAQEAGETQARDNTPTPEYEHLQVLEPLTGSFSPDELVNREVKISSTWGQRKRMIIWSAMVKLEEQEEWRESLRRLYFYWNENEQRIECLEINPGRGGRVDTSEVLIEDGNQFVFKPLSSNRSGGKMTQRWIVTNEGITMQTSRENADGLRRQSRMSLSRIE